MANRILEETKEQFQEVINALMDCERESRNCKKCKEKNNCLIFMRDSIALALQFIMNNLEEEEDIPEIYS